MRSTVLRRTAASVSIALAVVGLAGCGDDDDAGAGAGGSSSAATSAAAAPTPPPVENAVTIKGVDYGYVLDKPAVDSGTTKITFANEGKDAHMLVFGAIAAGKTFADAQAVLKTEDEKDDSAVFSNFGGDSKAGPFGTPDILTAGASTTTYTELKPGSYALICFFPTPDGKPHFAAGMLAEFTVNATATTAAAPTTTAEATLADDKITIPDLSSGKATLKVTNTGKKDHNFFLAKIPAGSTLEAQNALVAKYFMGQAKVETLGELFQGGVSALPPGSSAVLELNLSPGTYVVICTESDSDEDGKEHFVLNGEKAPFTVV
ncbi:MAG TPA: hypothetical protein VNB94_13085 [Mycobacteriales bacterium]|nr:hypothetical protein [Mycobacteriales bacterium]